MSLTTTAAALLSSRTSNPSPQGMHAHKSKPAANHGQEIVSTVPQAVWLFAPDPAAAVSAASGQQRAHADIIEACHDRGIKVFVQVGNVAAAREALQDGADVLVAQGVDAGGHQFVAGAGIVSLVPEVKAMVAEEGKAVGNREVVVVAAGGIADGSAVVGAIALGEFLYVFCPPPRTIYCSM